MGYSHGEKGWELYVGGWGVYGGRYVPIYLLRVPRVR